MKYEELVKNLGIQGFQSGNEYRGKCPFHNDKNPSFSVNTQTGLWHCHAGCGSGNFTTLVMKVQNVTFMEAQTWIESLGNNPSVQELSLKLAQALGQDLAPEGYAEKGWRNYYDSLDCKAMPLWFLKRGFVWDTINRWGLRYDPLHDAAVIPVVWEDEFHGIIIRPYKELPKYQNNQELKKSKLLFGQIFPNEKYIILVEGVLDAIWLWQLGYNCVSIMGAELSLEQALILRKYRYGEIVLALDNDEAGILGTTKAVKLLVEQGWLLPQIKVVEFPGLEGEEDYRKDAQDCSADEFGEIFRSRGDVINGFFTPRDESAP